MLNKILHLSLHLEKKAVRLSAFIGTQLSHVTTALTHFISETFYDDNSINPYDSTGGCLKFLGLSSNLFLLLFYTSYMVVQSPDCIPPYFLEEDKYEYQVASTASHGHCVNPSPAGAAAVYRLLFNGPLKGY